MTHAGTPPLAERVSVVIPCYRQAHFLPDALASVMAQTHPAHEIVVVDDGSPDDVPAVVRGFPGVRCLTQDNRGLSGARNAGLTWCSGELVVFLDADDRLLPAALAMGREAFAEHPGAAFVWGFNRPIDGAGRVLGPISNPWEAGETTYADLLARNVVGPPVDVMFRRSSIVGQGGFSSAAKAAEDYAAYLELAREHPVFCHGRVVAEYRYHDAKMSSDRRRMLDGVLAALDAQRAHVRGDPALLRAWRRGRRHARHQYDGNPRVEAIGDDLRRGRWVRAGFGALGLLVRHPSLFLHEVRTRAARRAGRGSAAS